MNQKGSIKAKSLVQPGDIVRYRSMTNGDVRESVCVDVDHTPFNKSGPVVDLENGHWAYLAQIITVWEGIPNAEG